MNKVRALSVDIYESKNIGNCSNNGISNRFRTAYIICPDGNSYRASSAANRLGRGQKGQSSFIYSALRVRGSGYLSAD